jgi:hypothetical protein
MHGGYSFKGGMHNNRSHKRTEIFQNQNLKLTTPLRHISVRRRWKRRKVNQIKVKYNKRTIYSISLLYSKSSVPNAFDPPLFLIFMTAAKITIAITATILTIPIIAAMVLAGLLFTGISTICTLLMLRPKTKHRQNKLS